MLNVISMATTKKIAIEYTQKKMIKYVNISLPKKWAKTERRQKYKKQGTKEIIEHMENKLGNKKFKAYLMNKYLRYNGLNVPIKDKDLQSR